MDESTVIMAVAGAVTFAVPLITLIISLITFYATAKEKHAKSAAEQAQIAAKLDENSRTLNDMSEQMTKLIDGYHENHAAIVKLETRVEMLDGKVTDIESRIGAVETKIR